MKITLNINNERHLLEDVDPETPLLWVLRDTLGLVGTKYGCGIAMCGACTVHVEGTPARACVLAVRRLEGKAITTIEGMGSGEDKLHPLQQAWIEHDVPQCGYCQAGQIMSAAALLARNPTPSDKEINAAMSGNICRCGTYPRIVQAIKSIAETNT